MIVFPIPKGSTLLNQPVDYFIDHSVYLRPGESRQDQICQGRPELDLDLFIGLLSRRSGSYSRS